MKFKDKIKAKEYKQAKEAIKECYRREWKKSEGEGWITEKTYRVRRTKAEKPLPSFAFLTPYPTLLNPQPFLPPPTLPQTMKFTLLHKSPFTTAPITSPHATSSSFSSATSSSSFEMPKASDTSKPEIEEHIVEKHGEEQDEELSWEAVKILIEADGTSFYGLGEIAGSLQLNDLCQQSVEEMDLDEEENVPHNPNDLDPYYHPPYSEHEGKSSYKQRRSRRNKKGITICWNTDVGLYSHLNPSLYQSHPFLISLLRDGTSNAYFFDSTYLTIVHLSKVTLPASPDLHENGEGGKKEGKEYYQILFLSRSPASPPPLYIMNAKTPQEIAQEITRLFGSISLPPKWAVGYQQCRYSYYPDTRVLAVAESFRKYKIPCDVIWMDIHYMNEYRCFQFSSRHFPEPARLSNSLHSLGFHGVWMIDPGIKVDENYEVFKSGLRGDHFILKHTPKEPFDEAVELEHIDEPPHLDEYPEVKEAEGMIIDLIEEPGFNRAPDLEDPYTDEEVEHHQQQQRGDVITPSIPLSSSSKPSSTPSTTPSITPTAFDSPLPHQTFSSFGDSLPSVGESSIGESMLVEPLIGEGAAPSITMTEKEDEEEELQEKVVIRPKRLRKLEELEIGKVWPGDCAFPDFTRKETRKWWGALYANFLIKNGIDGVWNDMNEVASFGEGGTIHRKAWHRADKELGGADDHSRYHNVFGFLMTLATKQGMRHARKDKREFVLTRANYMGGHRHAATWTGDNTSNWDHLGWTVPMIINLSLSGQLFCGADIGGFFGDATPELFARWMGFGALLPFARAHTCVRTRNHEPWSFGSEVKRICKKAIERRYRLLGYYYTLFYEGAHITSLPILQPLFYLDPADQRLRDVDSIFTIGSSILVVTDIHPPPHLSPSHMSPLATYEHKQEGDDEQHWMAPERRKEYEEKEAERKRKVEMMLDANPSMNPDEDLVVEDEHLAEETMEEEEERKSRIKGRKEKDRFPYDLFDDRDQWIRFHVLEDFSDQFESELPEFYLRRGSVVPLIALSQHVLPPAQYFLQPLTLSFSFFPPNPSHPHIHMAEGTFYEDEGDSYDYQTLQSFSYIKFRIEKSSASLAYPQSLRQSREEINWEAMEEAEEGGEKVTVFMIHLSNSNAFFPDRTIHVVEHTHENAKHPTPIFSFHQSEFKESYHPAYPSNKVYSYVHHLTSQ